MLPLVGLQKKKATQLRTNRKKVDLRKYEFHRGAQVNESPSNQ